ncbi:MAG: hypothetical protein ACU83V_08095 [Gammaproteobacteria bacterium]
MKKPVVLFVLFTAALPGFVSADPNIYGPGGVNLGPNGELPPSDEELKKDRLVEEQREHIRALEEQVQQLQIRLNSCCKDKRTCNGAGKTR